MAALSCEAAKADIAAFAPKVSEDGFSHKDETDETVDMRMYMSASKFVGQPGSLAPLLFDEIPAVHGSFRKGVRILHEEIRVELNSALKVNSRTAEAGNRRKEKALLGWLLNLVTAIECMSEISVGRATLIVDSVGGQEIWSKVAAAYRDDNPKYVELRDKNNNNIPSLIIHADLRGKCENVNSGSDYFTVLNSAYDVLVKFREILGWEASVALYAFESNDSTEKSGVGSLTSIKVNGEDAKSEKKSEKKKKKTLGKGTSVIRQLLKDQLKKETPVEDVKVLADWARELALYFDPQDIGLDALLGKVKEILETNEVRRLPKTPKGTRDFGEEQMAIREHAFSTILRVFKMHGAVGLDTPVFELRETLMGKYGEDSKLIYDLADQGGELCSLRYDLTVPFARYVAMNNLSALKRYQIAKVYRRDNPSKGRYREFYQCDFDIAGSYETMEPDFEVIKVLTQLLDRLDIGAYEVKLNHRGLLDGMLEICGVTSEKFRTVCSSIDKLDKASFDQIKKELVEEKGLSIETAERIGTFVSKRGPPLELLSELKKEGSQFLDNNGSVLALNDLEILFKSLDKAKCLNKVVFDLSLARGLDYYTGVIFEAVLKGAQVGSIAAGGRYDNLVGMFSGKQVPAVGVSLGIERVFAILEDRKKEIRATETQVLVAVLSKDVALAAELVSELWDADIEAEFGLNKRVTNHINRAIKSRIPWVVIVGETELSSGFIKLKNIEANQEEDIPRTEMVKELQKRLRFTHQSSI